MSERRWFPLKDEQPPDGAALRVVADSRPVKGINPKGKIDAVDSLKAKPNNFLIIDKHTNPIENFFKNFLNQVKNPSHIGFYAIYVHATEEIGYTPDFKEFAANKYR